MALTFIVVLFITLALKVNEPLWVLGHCQSSLLLVWTCSVLKHHGIVDVEYSGDSPSFTISSVIRPLSITTNIEKLGCLSVECARDFCNRNDKNHPFLSCLVLYLSLSSYYKCILWSKPFSNIDIKSEHFFTIYPENPMIWNILDWKRRRKFINRDMLFFYLKIWKRE